MTTNTQRLLINPRLMAVLLLGFTSGLPLVLTGSTLQAWFTEAHIDLKTIGMLSLLGVPYTFKFLWAPLMDHYRIPRLGKRRGWILLMQAALVLTLMLLANMNPGTDATAMGMVALGVAFFSASQDISITAYQTDVLQPEERGLGVAYYIFAYRIATLVSGGLALVFADYLGWKITYEIMALLMLLSMLPTYLSPPVVEQPSNLSNVLQTMRAALSNLLNRDKMLLILFFIFFYKVGDALALQLMTNFFVEGAWFFPDRSGGGL